MKKIYLKIIISAVLLLLCGIVLYVWLNGGVYSRSQDHRDIDAVVIQNSYIGPGTSGKKDGAVLLTDREEVKRHADLFLNNYQAQHACGYNYNIEFWSGDVIIKFLGYNIDCGEEFSRDSDKIFSLMQEYDARFISGDVGTIYYLSIPVAHDPQALIQNLRKDGLAVFPFGLYARYPSLELEFTFQGKSSDALEAKGKEEMQVFLDNWSKNLPQPLHHTSPSASGWIIAEISKVTLDLTLWFALGVDLEQISDGIKADNIRIVRENTPQFYKLEVIVPKEDEGRFREVLKKYSDICVL